MAKLGEKRRAALAEYLQTTGSDADLEALWHELGADDRREVIHRVKLGRLIELNKIASRYLQRLSNAISQPKAKASTMREFAIGLGITLDKIDAEESRLENLEQRLVAKERVRPKKGPLPVEDGQ